MRHAAPHLEDGQGTTYGQDVTVFINPYPVEEMQIIYSLQLGGGVLVTAFVPSNQELTDKQFRQIQAAVRAA